MKKAEKHKRDDEAQSKRFIDMAREIKADETKEGADRAFKKASARRPPPALKPSSPKRT